MTHQRSAAAVRETAVPLHSTFDVRAVIVVLDFQSSDQPDQPDHPHWWRQRHRPPWVVQQGQQIVCCVCVVLVELASWIPRRAYQLLSGTE